LDYREQSIQFINSKNLQIKKLPKLKLITTKNAPKKSIFIIYLIEEHTFNPPRKSEFHYPLVSRQNELTKIDQSNCAVWRRRKGKWPVFGKNNLKISGGE